MLRITPSLWMLQAKPRKKNSTMNKNQVRPLPLLHPFYFAYLFIFFFFEKFPSWRPISSQENQQTSLYNILYYLPGTFAFFFSRFPFSFFLFSSFAFSSKNQIRAAVTIWRNPMLTRVRTIQTLFLAFLVGLLFLQIGHDQSSLQDRNGSLFFICICISTLSLSLSLSLSLCVCVSLHLTSPTPTTLTFSSLGLTPLMLMQAVFPVERALFVREHSTGSYSTFAYFLCTYYYTLTLHSHSLSH